MRAAAALNDFFFFFYLLLSHSAFKINILVEWTFFGLTTYTFLMEELRGFKEMTFNKDFDPFCHQFCTCRRYWGTVMTLSCLGSQTKMYCATDGFLLPKIQTSTIVNTVSSLTDCIALCLRMAAWTRIWKQQHMLRNHETVMWSVWRCRKTPHPTRSRSGVTKGTEEKSWIKTKNSSL